MAASEDKEKNPEEAHAADGGSSSESAPPEAEPRDLMQMAAEFSAAGSSLEGTAAEGEGPVQLGSRRFVFAGYFAFAICVAFIMTKTIGYAWYRLSQWKPALGEEKAEITMPIAGALGALVAIYYWRDKKVRTMVEEIASELSKVTWPTKQEVTSNTIVVVVTTAVATAFFSFMDWFWGQITNRFYGS